MSENHDSNDMSNSTTNARAKAPKNQGAAQIITTTKRNVSGLRRMLPSSEEKNIFIILSCCGKLYT